MLQMVDAMRPLARALPSLSAPLSETVDRLSAPSEAEKPPD